MLLLSYSFFQTGGRRVPSDQFHHVRDSHVLQRLRQVAHGKVLELDLTAAAITDLGTLRPYGFGKSWNAPLEIFINGKPLRLAEWPNYVSSFHSQVITVIFFTAVSSVPFPVSRCQFREMILFLLFFNIAFLFLSCPLSVPALLAVFLFSVLFVVYRIF